MVEPHLDNSMVKVLKYGLSLGQQVLGDLGWRALSPVGKACDVQSDCGKVLGRCCVLRVEACHPQLSQMDSSVP